jgi:hypothetical protein
MATVFVSFDWHHDRRYKYLLEAWDANTRFDFEFDDGSSQEIDTYNVGRIKGALTTKINEASHTLIVVGEHANERHRNSSLIGYRNWINFEAARSVDAHNSIVVVFLEPWYDAPIELAGQNYTSVFGFTEAGIIAGLDRATPAWRRAS